LLFRSSVTPPVALFRRKGWRRDQTHGQQLHPFFPAQRTHAHAPLFSYCQLTEPPRPVQPFSRHRPGYSHWKTIAAKRSA
jgi:hypothetical protein